VISLGKWKLSVRGSAIVTLNLLMAIAHKLLDK
jgi:hypothetical protein